MSVGQSRKSPIGDGDLELVARWRPRSVAAVRRSSRIEQLEGQVARLLAGMRVAVIYGGDKSVAGAVINQTSNPRSWKSYRNVAEDIAGSLQRLGCRTVQLMVDDMTLGENLRREGIHFAWLNTGGVQGYSPMTHTAAMLEMFGIPYVGHDPLTAGMLDNKLAFKRELQALSIPTAPYATWHPNRGPFNVDSSPGFRSVFHSFDGPFVVKPVSGRASLHVHHVEHRRQLAEVVTEVYWTTGNHVLIEAYLSGREFCVAVCGPIAARQRQLWHNGEPFVFSFIERNFQEEEKIFASMDVRPITGERFRIMKDATDGDLIERIREVAQQVYIEMDLETLVRLDLRMDTDGEIYVLEANPKPDLKRPSAESTSLVAAGLPDCGMDFDDLILSLFADRIDLIFSQKRGLTTLLSTVMQ